MEKKVCDGIDELSVEQKRDALITLMKRLSAEKINKIYDKLNSYSGIK